jgi:hypothetical protein
MEPSKAKAILKNKNKVEGMKLLDFKATIVRIVLSWHKDRHTHQQNRIESPGENPYICGKLTFHKSVKTVSVEQIINVAGITGYSHAYK